MNGADGVGAAVMGFRVGDVLGCELAKLVGVVLAD